jgi:hypothetical protein
VLRADGPIRGRFGLVTTLDVSGRLDADPVSAPAPVSPLDPRTDRPYPLPHNTGEQWTGAAKLVIPATDRATLRVLGLHSEDQRLLYDPAYKYDPVFAPAQRLRGDLVSGHLQYLSDPRRGAPISVDLRVARLVREFVRGELDGEVDYAIGGITGSRFRFIGEELARAQDPSGEPIPGLRAPVASVGTPWGVPAFFLTEGSRGELGWNRFGETRLQLDASYGGFSRLDLYVGGEYTAQQVRTWQRAFGYLPVGALLPDATAVPAVAIRLHPGRLPVKARAGPHEDVATPPPRHDQFDPQRPPGRSLRHRALGESVSRHPHRALRRHGGGTTVGSARPRLPVPAWRSTIPPAPGGSGGATPPSASSRRAGMS